MISKVTAIIGTMTIVAIIAAFGLVPYVNAAIKPTFTVDAQLKQTNSAFPNSYELRNVKISGLPTGYTDAKITNIGGTTDPIVSISPTSMTLMGSLMYKVSPTETSVHSMYAYSSIAKIVNEGNTVTMYGKGPAGTGTDALIKITNGVTGTIHINEVSYH